MSEEDVEMVRKHLDAFNAFMRGDLTREEVADMFHPQIEWHWHDQRTFPDLPQDLRGVRESIAFWEQYRSAWVDLVREPLEITEAPDGRVLAFTRLSGRGRESGVPIVIHFFTVFTIRDGRVRKAEIFRHRADALEAAGLSE
jgi:ketosteroid isomerase-like protein